MEPERSCLKVGLCVFFTGLLLILGSCEKPEDPSGPIIGYYVAYSASEQCKPWAELDDESKMWKYDFQSPEKLIITSPEGKAQEYEVNYTSESKVEFIREGNTVFYTYRYFNQNVELTNTSNGAMCKLRKAKKRK